MATKEEGSEPVQDKTWVLRVSIHCEGCKKKVRRILKSVPGVITTEIDSQQNKVTVTGDVEADTLIRKLAKSGKHAELWPMEKKPNNSNPNPNPSGKEKGKEVGKEKDASKFNEPNSKPERAPEKSAPTATSPGTDTKPAETASKEQAPAATKPAESDTKPPEGSNKEVSKPDPKPDKAPATSSETETETKPADTATKSNSSGKKKSKNKGVEAAGNEEVFVMNSGDAPPMHLQPPYPQQVYTASYNVAHPASNYSYYAPMSPQPQSYTYSSHPPPPQGYMYPNHPPLPEYYPHYPRENYYPHESYYETAPSSSQPRGSYDYFSDENANSCIVM